MLKEYFVVTPPYEVSEGALLYDCRDVVKVWAVSTREAVVEAWSLLKLKGWVRLCRQEGRNPFTGIKAHRMEGTTT